MARRNEDRLDVICRTFETVFKAHDADKAAWSATYDAVDQNYGDCLKLLDEVMQYVTHSKLPQPLRDKLRKYVEVLDEA